MPLDWTTLQALVDFTDDLGVLSVYVTADPQEEAASRPAWQIRVRNQLSRLRGQVRAEGPRVRRMALEERLKALTPDLEHLLDPAAPGLGRVLFAALARPEARTISLQMPLDDLVVLESAAYLRPLLAAWAAGSPAGVAAVSSGGVEITELRLGTARQVATIPYAPTDENRRELKGPAAANPALSQQTAPQRDLFDRRERERLLLFLRSLGPRLHRLRDELGWEYLAVTGDTPLVNALADGVPAGAGCEILQLPYLVASRAPADVATAVAADLTAARQQRARRLAEQARHTALAGGTATLGLSDTLAALQQHQVSHLVLDGNGHWRGQRAGDGRLTAAGETPPGADLTALAPEPRLGERMIELALRGGAAVTLLDPPAAALLRESCGVAAILRW